MCRAFGVWLLVCLSLLGRTARGDSFISLEMQVPLKEEPGHLCVVTARATQLVDPKKKASSYSSLPLKALSLDAQGRMRTIPQQVRSNPAFDSILRALMMALPPVSAPLGPGRELAGCAEPFAECDARFDQTPTVREWFDKDLLDAQKLELHLTCGGNVAHPNSRGPVVFVALNLIHGADAPITEIRLDGSVAALRFAGRLDAGEAAAVRVLGGHYAPSLTVFTTNGRAVLPLQPRCLVSVVRLPLVAGIATQIQRVTVERQGAGATPRACKPQIAEQSFLLHLPYHDERVETRVQAELGADALLEARWFEPTQPAQLTLQLKQVGFSWRPDCAYALGALGCPRAWLEGIECSKPEPNAGTCAYTCRAAGSFKLPAPVEFSADDSRQRWSDRLGRPAEELFGLPDTRVRQVGVDFSKWRNLPDVERASIDGVEIQLPDRTTAFIDLRGKIFNLDQKPGEDVRLANQELAAVRLACGAPLLYRVRGLPRYSPNGAVGVEDGRVVIPSPKCSELSECASIETALRLGLLSRGAQSGVGPSHFGTGVYLQGDLAVRYVPWAGWWFADAGYSLGIGNREYVAVEETELHQRWAPYGRIAYRLALGVRTLDLRPVLPPAQLGIGIEGGYGHVLTLGGARAMGGDFYVAPNAFVRFGRLAIAFRILWFEELAFIDQGRDRLVKAPATTYYGYELRHHFDLNP